MSFSSDMPAGRMRGFLELARSALTRTDEQAVARRAAAMALAIRVVNAVLAYVAQVILARLMGQFEYGVFAFTWVWFLVFSSLATFGFCDSTLRFVPVLRRRGELDHLRGFLRLGAGMVALGGLLAALLILGALPLASTVLDEAYLYPMVLMALVLPFAAAQAYLEGLGRSYFWTFPALFPIYIMRHGLLLALMVGAVALGFEATAATALVCVILTVTIALAYQLVAIGRRLSKAVPRGPRAYRPREWIVGSLPFSVLYGTAHFFAFADVVVLSFFVSPTELAVYFAATRVMQVVALIPYAATVGTAHLISASHAVGDVQRMRMIVREVVFWTFFMASAVTLVVGLGGQWLLALFGEGFGAGYTALLILAGGIMAKVAAGPAEDLLNMTGHSRLSAWTYGVSMVINIALNVALIIPFGIVGAALATSAAVALRSFWLALAARRLIGIDTWIFAARPSVAALRALAAGPPGETPNPAE